MYTWPCLHWHFISLELGLAYITPWAPSHSWWQIACVGVRPLIRNHWCDTLGSMSNFCQLKKSTKRIWPSLHSNLWPLLSINDCCTIGFNNCFDMWWCFAIIHTPLYLWIPPSYYPFEWAVLLLKALVALSCSQMEVGCCGLHSLWGCIYFVGLSNGIGFWPLSHLGILISFPTNFLFCYLAILFFG